MINLVLLGVCHVSRVIVWVLVIVVISPLGPSRFSGVLSITGIHSRHAYLASLAASQSVLPRLIDTAHLPSSVSGCKEL